MQENSKHIRSLIAGLLANNDAKVDQITEALVDSMFQMKRDVVADALKGIFQGKSNDE